MATALSEFRSNLKLYNPSNSTIWTGAGLLYLAPAGASIDFSSKNLTSCGAITCTDLTVSGTTTTVNTTNLTIQDQLVVINSGGLDATSIGAGFTIDATAVPNAGYFKTSSDGKGFVLKAPLSTGAYVLTLPELTASTNVALLGETQTFSGTKTFSAAPVMSGASVSTGTLPRAAVAVGTAGHVVFNDGTTGAVSSEATLALVRGGLAQDLSAFSSTSGYLKNINGTISLVANPVSNIVNADIDANAAIALWKLATGTNYYSVFRNGSGVLTESWLLMSNGSASLLKVAAPVQFDTVTTVATATMDVLKTIWLQTASNTATAIYTLTTSEYFTYIIKMFIVGNKKTNAIGGVWEHTYRVAQGAANSSPTVTLLQSNVNNDDAAVVIAELPASNAFSVTVQGPTAVAYNWKAMVTQVFADTTA